MDVVTYALLNKKVSSILPGYTYKGGVASADDLPDDAETGDLYTVGSTQYVWNGSAWVAVGQPITEAHIRSLFT